MELNTNSYLWDYISQGQKDLMLEGNYLMEKVIREGKYNFKDYSFLVFPFAKAYEGFLKQLFLDIGFITRDDYRSDHFRIGRVLSPNLARKLGSDSVYLKIKDTAGTDLAQKMWDSWRIGRNQVFHYFPHNLQSLSFSESEDIVNHLMRTMKEAVMRLKIEGVKSKLHKYMDQSPQA